MNNTYKCLFTFTSPQTGKTYFEGAIIDQYEYDKLAYSDSKKFKIINPKLSINLGIPSFDNPFWY